MRVRLIRIVAAAGLAGSLSACGGAPDLVTLSSPGQGPDEFSIVPNKPLQTPESYASLPPPTLGGANRGDPTPAADAVAALGGSRAAATGGGGVQGPELMRYARRYGVDGAIRPTLAAEDQAFRARNDGRLLERLFNVTVYYRVYRPLSLDQDAELARLRRQGVRTPAAPPEDVR